MRPSKRHDAIWWCLTREYGPPPAARRTTLVAIVSEGLALACCSCLPFWACSCLPLPRYRPPRTYAWPWSFFRPVDLRPAFARCPAKPIKQGQEDHEVRSEGSKRREISTTAPHHPETHLTQKQRSKKSRKSSTTASPKWAAPCLQNHVHPNPHPEWN